MLLQLRGVGGSSGGVGRGGSGGAGDVLDGLRGVLRLALHTWIMGMDEFRAWLLLARQQANAHLGLGLRLAGLVLNVRHRRRSACSSFQN